jgi:muconolactone D-isomerase
MLYHVRMDVHPPADPVATKFEQLKADEKQMAQELQRKGVWVHLWRIAGQYSNISVFDVGSHDELHALLSNLPLFPFMAVTVMPLARHPSAIDPA